MSAPNPPEPETPRGSADHHVTLHFDPTLRPIVTTIGWMLIAAGAAYALSVVWPVISILIQTALPFLVGLIFAYIFDPIVAFFQVRLHLSRVWGVMFLYLVIATAALAFIALGLPSLILQVEKSIASVSSFIETQIQENSSLGALAARVRIWLEANGINIQEFFADAAKSDGVQGAAKTAATEGIRFAGEAVSFLFTLLTGILGGVFFLVLAFLVNLYMLLEFSGLRRMLEVVVPLRHQARTFQLMTKVDVAVGGYMRGMLIAGFVVGTLTFLGLWMIGLGEFALLIGILAGVGNLIPYCGAPLGAGPALLVVIFGDGYGSGEERLFRAGAILALTAIIQTIDGFILQPRVVGKSAQLHEIAVLFALALGANYGLLGMIVAVPTACIARVLIKEFYWDRREVAYLERAKPNVRVRKSREVNLPPPDSPVAN